MTDATGGSTTICATCGEVLPSWPIVAVPQPDGSMASYHEACSPWASTIADDLVGGLELLSDDELASVTRLVHTLVDRDEDQLRHLCAIEEGVDPYEPTRRWREWPQVDLTVPPGDPTEWEAEVYGTPSRGWTVDIRMWTAQEAGPSELMLHLDVIGDRIDFRGLWS